MKMISKLTQIAVVLSVVTFTGAATTAAAQVPMPLIQTPGILGLTLKNAGTAINLEKAQHESAAGGKQGGSGGGKQGGGGGSKQGGDAGRTQR